MCGGCVAKRTSRQNKQSVSQFHRTPTMGHTAPHAAVPTHAYTRTSTSTYKSIPRLARGFSEPDRVYKQHTRVQSHALGCPRWATTEVPLSSGDWVDMEVEGGRERCFGREAMPHHLLLQGQYSAGDSDHSGRVSKQVSAGKNAHGGEMRPDP